MDITLKGYKGKIGGVGIMVAAIAKVCVDFYNGEPVDINAAVTQFLVGLGILGVRVAMD
jgi:hypothetical protein